MSLFDSASLVVTPNGYKEDKLYSIKPTDGSGDLVVTRATTATRVNGANLVEVVPRNLLTYSKDLSSGYTLNQCTITSNQTAFDGTSNARRITNGATATDPYFEQSVSFAPTTYTWSIYVKQGTAASAAIKPVHVGIGGDVSLMTFTFATETISSSGIITSTGFTKLTNGWYRIYCSVNITSSVSNLRGRFGNPNVANVYNDWAYPQLEASTTASEFLPTTTRLNIPRIDYTNGSCPSILVEPQRTNVILRSQEFDNAYWTKQNASIVINSTTSPDGTLNASKLVEDTANSRHYINATNTIVTATQQTASIYIKAAGRTKFALSEEVATGAYASFNLANGTVLDQNGISAKITPLTNGWFKCEYTINSTIFFLLRIVLLPNSYTSGSVNGTYTGDGTSGVFLYGAQLEQGSYSTSYIPTVASTVTRNADVISKTGISSLIGQTEGTLFCEVLQMGGNTIVPFQLSTTTNNNRAQIEISDVGAPLCVVSSGGVNTAVIVGSYLPFNQYHKIAITYKANEFKLYVNGALVGTDTSGAIPTSLTALYIGSESGTTYAGFQMKSAVHWKEVLTNDQLIALTTI
jgi:hypothetical protein